MPTTEKSGPVSPPVADGVFADATDPAVFWYLPTLVATDPDPAFRFAVTQSVGADGAVTNQANLVLSAVLGDPPTLDAARAARPGTTFRRIEPEAGPVHLVVPFTDATGAARTTLVEETPVAGADAGVHGFAVAGPAVIQVYEGLTQLAGLTVQTALSYSLDLASWHDTPEELAAEEQARKNRDATIAGLDERIADDQASLQLDPPPIAASARTDLRAAEDELAAIRRLDDAPTSGSTRSPQTTDRVLRIGSAYAGPAYAAKYTVTVGDTTRPILDVRDLQQFDVARSQFRELTSIPDLQSRFPSFQRLYIAVQSGVVVAVPVAYGIVRSRTGLAARIDALVDESPASLTGSRFHAAFQVAPVVDPVDTALLGKELLSIPEAAGRPLQLVLPSGLDPRVTATFGGSTATGYAYANGTAEHSLLLSVDFADNGHTPAISEVNLFLGQLGVPPALALFGSVGLRLDDLYPPVVTSQVIVNLNETSPGDELDIVLSPSPPTVQVRNLAPFALRTLRFATVDDAGTVAVTPFDDVLAPGAVAPLPVTGAPGDVRVHAGLDLPEPFDPGTLSRYVQIHAETVSSVQHPLIVNATGVDFAARGILRIDIRFSLRDMPTLVVPSITLTPAHRVDSVNVLVPVAAAVGGLPTTITVTATRPDPQGVQDVELTNDFVAQPIFLLLSTALDAHP